MHHSETIAVDGTPMELVVAQPDAEGPFPGLLVGKHNPAHASLAEDLFTTDTAERFAAAGYVSDHAEPIPSLAGRLEPMASKLEKLNDKDILVDLNAGLATVS